MSEDYALLPFAIMFEFIHSNFKSKFIILNLEKWKVNQ